MMAMENEVSRLLEELLVRVQLILGEDFVGMYLYGSLAGGGFDACSDVDVLIVTGEELDAAQFEALQAMHAAIYARGGYWDTQLEVCYLPRRAVRRYDPQDARHAYLDRGSAQLEWMDFGISWRVQMHLLQQRGICLAGPPPADLIDPVPVELLQATLRELQSAWLGKLHPASQEFASRGYQSYIVLTQCRILYTLRFGEVVPKQQAARWALEWLEPRWAALVERALADRQSPDGTPDVQVVQETLEFIQAMRSIAGDQPAL